LKPLIAVTAHDEWAHEKYSLNRFYWQGVLDVGGLPVMVGNLDEDSIHSLLERVDGILLTGGGDIDPSFFGENPVREMKTVAPERDGFEVQLVKRAYAMGIPLMGICRGMQVINVALGGSLYQDIYTQHPNAQRLWKHDQDAPGWWPTHTVCFTEDGFGREIFGTGKMRVNSFHHQAIKDPAPGLKVAAYAEDGIIELIEGGDGVFVLGVQWHPERMMNKDTKMLGLFRALIDKCKR
jgi:putative glutamine amidotransferase